MGGAVLPPLDPKRGPQLCLLLLRVVPFWSAVEIRPSIYISNVFARIPERRLESALGMASTTPEWKGRRKGLRQVREADMMQYSRLASVKMFGRILVKVGSKFYDGER